jgi:hypothetical protein
MESFLILAVLLIVAAAIYRGGQSLGRRKGSPVGRGCGR